jgi:hypothetical protein
VVQTKRCEERIMLEDGVIRATLAAHASEEAALNSPSDGKLLTTLANSRVALHQTVRALTEHSKEHGCTCDKFLFTPDRPYLEG